jgi:uncharacterized protein with HEPN domain
MQPDARDAALLYDMPVSAQRALTYARGRLRANLDTDHMLADAIERRIEIVGEAARGISNAFRDAHAEIRWRAIMATRHILAHDYDEVNHDIIWRIITDHLPLLIKQLEALMPQTPQPEADGNNASDGPTSTT